MKNLKASQRLLHYFFPNLIFMLSACYGGKQIQVNDSLSSNSEIWKAKIRGGDFSIGRTSFGAFNTVSCAKLDSPRLNSGNGPFIFPAFRYEVSSRKRKAYSLRVSGNTDTASLLFFVWFNSKTSEPGFFSLDRGSSASNIKDADGVITIGMDTAAWIFSISSYGVSLLNTMDLYKKTSGYLVYKQDTIRISHVGEFTGGGQGLGHIVSKGITLTRNGEQIAALQLLGDNYVWIRKDLPLSNQLAIAAFFSAILGSKDL